MMVQYSSGINMLRIKIAPIWNATGNGTENIPKMYLQYIFSMFYTGIVPITRHHMVVRIVVTVVSA